MADDPKQRHGQDRDRINVHQDHELRDWARSLGVAPQRVKEAVEAVGDRADKVREYLAGKPALGTVEGTSEGTGRSKPADRNSDR